MVSADTIKSKKDFDLLYQKGKTLHGKFFYLRYLPAKNGSNPSRFAIIIGLKISKKAVERNKKRRQLKEIIRLNTDKIKKGFLILVVAKEGILEADYQELEKEFLGLVNKAGLNN
jgi:ribonuclease P protein component